MQRVARASIRHFVNRLSARPHFRSCWAPAVSTHPHTHAHTTTRTHTAGQLRKQAGIRFCTNLHRTTRSTMTSTSEYQAADMAAAAERHGIQLLRVPEVPACAHTLAHTHAHTHTHTGAHTHAGATAPSSAVCEWFHRTQTFLLDCDGVLWRGSAGIPGVAATVSALRRAGKRVFFVSNNSSASRTTYVGKLAKVAGILDAREEEVVTSAHSAAEYLARVGVRRKVYCIGMEGLVAELQAVGLTVLGPDDFSRSFSFGTMKPSDLDPEVEAVVVGFDGRLSYYKIAMASSYLRYNSCVRFVATNRDTTFPDQHMVVPGGGIAVQAVETGSGRSPELVAGKPSHSMLELLEASAGIDRATCCMVGDRLDTDILFGNFGGLGSTLMVLTGVSTAAEVAALPAGDKHVPTHMIASFGDFAQIVEAILASGDTSASQ